MKLFFLAYIFCCQYSFGQSDSTIYFKEFGWTIKLPSDLKIVKPETTVEPQRRGRKKERTIDKKIDSTDIVKLLSAEKDTLNSIVVHYNNSKKINSANYDSVDNVIKHSFFMPYKDNFGGTIDTLSSVILIDGNKFCKYQIHINVKEKLELVMWKMTTFYRNHFIIVAAVYTNKIVGEQIEKMLLESKFEK